jgi:hypothetical protein
MLTVLRLSGGVGEAFGYLPFAANKTVYCRSLPDTKFKSFCLVWYLASMTVLDWGVIYCLAIDAS